MNNAFKDAESFVDKTESRFEAAKQKLSQAIESGSEQLIAGAEAIKETAQNSADSLSNGAIYLRDRKSSQMLQDCTSLFRKYPLHALTLATVAGIILGKSIWGKSESD